jgi:hypothetical protein
MRVLRAILLVILSGLSLSGCEPASEPVVPIWEQVKIGELAPPSPDSSRQAKFLATVNLDVYTLDVPAENIRQLDDLWQTLSAKPIQTNSYSAFAGNSFRVRLGRTTMWEQVRDLLAAAGAQDAGTTSLVIGNDEPANLPVANVPQNSEISFVGTDLSSQTVKAGPGLLVLRLREQAIPGARGVRKIIAYPVYTLALTSAIPELDEQNRRREFYFDSAAFAAQMTPGDLLVLAPDSYSGETLTLGGRFFNRPEPVLFFDTETKEPPKRRPAFRVLVVVCTRIND